MLFILRLLTFGSMLIALGLVSGCANNEFKLRDLAKSDIDLVTEAHYEQSQQFLKELTKKLYKRNPREGRKQRESLEKRLEKLFSGSGPLVFDEINGALGSAAIELALNPAFKGDRVFALIAGMNHMVRQSYGFHSEFYFLTQLNEQKLYLSARNLEIVAWRLSQHTGEDGQPLLLTNSLPGEPANLSYERLFGKLIATQDLLAFVIAQKNQRVINKVAQNVATMAFFPL